MHITYIFIYLAKCDKGIAIWLFYNIGWLGTKLVQDLLNLENIWTLLNNLKVTIYTYIVFPVHAWMYKLNN